MRRSRPAQIRSGHVKVVFGPGVHRGSRPTMRRMPTSVVTGGAGFLGSHLCEHLLTEGHRVICVDNLDTGSLTNIEHIRDDAFTFVNHDVTAHIELAEDVDFIFHFASPASPIDYLRLPLHTLKVGAYGTHNALGLAKFKRARIVLGIDQRGLRRPARAPAARELLGERQPDRPARRVRRGKAFRRGVTMAYHRQQGVDTASSGSSTRTAADAAERRPGDSHFLSRPSGQPLTVFGDGSQTRSFCYVEDLIAGIWRLLDLRRDGPSNRQPRGVHAAPARRGGDRRDRVGKPDRVRVAARERSGAAAARHHPRKKICSAGNRLSRSRRAFGWSSSGRPGTS